MPLTKIEQLLKDKIGLDAVSVGSSAIRHAVDTRMSACQMVDVAEYGDHLSHSSKELKELIEMVVVPETWFFRDSKPFVRLKECVQSKKPSKDPLRILSLPCSTGEEPYSIAVTLFEGGLLGEQFTIDAFDISTQALERAKQASYGPHSFRGQQDPNIISHYFDKNGERYSPAEHVRKQVNFAKCNLLKDTLHLGASIYDVIFCRNLLIYFDEPTKLRAYRTLHRLLKDDGLLFLGHADCGMMPAKLFTGTGPANAFAFQKTSQAGPGSGKNLRSVPFDPVTRIRKPVSKPKPVPEAPQPDGENVTQLRTTDTAGPTGESGNSDLDHARVLADRGELEEAIRMCEKCLHSNEKRAHAHFLLGLLQDASGHSDQAEQHLRKALYLDPKHCEALIHLSLLLEQRGEPSEAELLRRRAERVRAASNN